MLKTNSPLKQKTFYSLTFRGRYMTKGLLSTAPTQHPRETYKMQMRLTQKASEQEQGLGEVTKLIRRSYKVNKAKKVK